ncbi:UNVERIFIED_CONTAM: hypothetical protein Scaly_2427900 [Sesamum calycinum]|uniref:Uncharacterized protein n=1 Tax=Sesamum calycinum TaxID=2727403 RepID=A0AAW2M1W0_9LAMI
MWLELEARFVEGHTREKLVSNCTGIEGGKTLMEQKRRNGVVGPRAFNANSEIGESGSQRGGAVTNNGANLLLALISQQVVSEQVEMTMEGAKFEVMKFDGTRNFGLCQTRVKDLLAQQGILKPLQPHKLASMDDEDWDELQQRATVWTEDVGGFRFGAACERLQSAREYLIYRKETIKVDEIIIALLAHNQRKQNAGENSHGDSLYVKGNQDHGWKLEKEGSGK